MHQLNTITSETTGYTYTVSVEDGSATITWTDADYEDQRVESGCHNGVLLACDVPAEDRALLATTVLALHDGTYVDGCLIQVRGTRLDGSFVRATVHVRIGGYTYEGSVSLVPRPDGRPGLATAGDSLDCWASDDVQDAVVFGREQGLDVVAEIVGSVSESAREIGIG